VTNVSMGTELHSVNEFEEILCLDLSLTLDDVSGSALNTGAEAEPTPAR
jgi:glyoxylate carboligase